jgi:hypothetical protein
MSILETTFRDRVDGTFTVVFSEMAGCRSEHGASISSGIVEAVGYRWSVKLYPTGIVGASLDHLCCYLMNESPESVEAAFSLMLVDDRGEEFGPFRSVGLESFKPKPEGNNNVTMQGFSNIFPSRRCNHVTVTVNLSTFGPRCVRTLTSLHYAKGGGSINESVNLLSLLSSGDMSDFAIVARCAALSGVMTEDWKRIPVHKLILSLRSPVLKTMIGAGLSESVNGELRITDFDADVVHKFVRFLYTGSCDAASHVEQLLALAHRYEVPGLQRLCEHLLKTRLTSDNALQVLSVAELYSSVELRKAVVEFLGRSAKTHSAAFLAEVSPELAHEVLCTMAGVDRKVVLSALK